MLAFITILPRPPKTFVFISSRIVCKEKQGQGGVEARRNKGRGAGKSGHTGRHGSQSGSLPTLRPPEVDVNCLAAAV